jgi:hypothetical protein
VGIGFCWPNETHNQVYQKKNILTTTNYATKCVEAKALRTNITVVITKFIYEFIFTRFGSSFILVSDQGTHFINDAIEIFTIHFLL